MSSNIQSIESLVSDFASRLVAAVEGQLSQQIRTVVSAALADSGITKRQVEQTTKMASGSAAPAGRRKLRLSPKGIAARKLQGKYLGLLRGLNPGSKARVKKVAREEGVAAALKFAASMK